jgi:hypothetical protein
MGPELLVESNRDHGAPTALATAPPIAARLVLGNVPPHMMVSLGLSTSGLGPTAGVGNSLG